MIILVAVLLIASMMYLLLKNKVSPIVAFVCIPIISAVILILTGNFTSATGEVVPLAAQFDTLFGWVTNGVKTTMGNATLFIFSIIYFGIMSDAGMFDPIVKALVKIAGKNPVMVYITTALIAIVSQLDGATATTYLVTIPAMLPIFKKLKLNVLAMLTVIGTVTGAWNMIPWGGTVIRTATTMTNLGVPITPQDLWRMILPLEVLGMMLGFGLAVYFGIQDKKRLVREYGSEFLENVSIDKIEVSDEVTELKRPKLLAVNLILTGVIIIVMMFYSKVPSYIVFLIATAIALSVNYKGLKLQNERIAAHAPNALGTAVTFLAAGVFLGIFKETGMTTALANVILNLLPDPILHQVGRIFGVMGSAVGIIISPDLYYYSLLPVVGEVVQTLGGNPIKVGISMLIGENMGIIISPCIPTTFLAIGLAEVELKDHIKFSLKYFIGVSFIMIVVAMFMGVA